MRVGAPSGDQALIVLQVVAGDFNFWIERALEPVSQSCSIIVAHTHHLVQEEREELASLRKGDDW
jgi:hypothetical protein